jgi:hypothetical protein
MIFDVEKAFIDYLEENNHLIVGNGNATVPIHRESFPDDALPIGISVYAELRESHRDVPELEICNVRFLTRHLNAEAAFIMMQNLDLTFDKAVRLRLNSTLELALCNRNSGPSSFNDSVNITRNPMQGFLYYQVALYGCIFRRLDE